LIEELGMGWKQKVVIHTEFGGFTLTPEIVKRLKARECEWIDRCGGPHGGAFYLPYEEEDPDALRRDLDLIEVVEELTKQYEAKIDAEQGTRISWRDRAELRRDLLGGLKVVEVTIEIEIEDYDGKETVRVSGGVW